MKHRIIFLLEGVIILLIFVVGYKIALRLRPSYDPHEVSVLKRDDLLFSNIEGLKYFYEPKPGMIEKRNPDWLGYEADYTINADTLNSTREYAVPKPAGTYRIEAIGDSFTFGEYVSTQNTWVNLLETSMHSVQCPGVTTIDVLNLGVYGYDIPYSVARFTHRGLKYEPDLVILLINDWMLTRDNELFIPLEKKKVDEGVQYYNPKTGYYDAAIAADTEIRNRIGYDTIVQKNSSLISSLTDRYPGKLLLVSFSSLPPKYAELLNGIVSVHPNRVFYTTLPPIYQDRTYSLRDSHPNTKGHAYIAAHLFDYMKQSKLECPQTTP